MKKNFIYLIELYQKYISKFLESKNIRCKFYPTCSEYTKQAIDKYGAFRGCMLGIVRILKCNPFSKGGYDPLK
ncbi:MAG: membrane protein insertion efficiency factor YidD [Clostridia bacterium]|nr:membrane protein insertion efficiency factor YidD [Clostridia bacterium]